MRCPFCYHALVDSGKTVQAEDIMNETYTEKVYVCENKNCQAANEETFWGSDGFIFSSSRALRDNFKNLFTEKKCAEALDSIGEKCQMASEKDVLNFHFGKYDCWRLFDLTLTKEQSVDNINGVNQYVGIPRYHFRLAFKGTYYTPGIYMLWFCLKGAYRQKNGGYTQNILKDLENTWDKRWWKVTYKFILKHILVPFWGIKKETSHE